MVQFASEETSVEGIVARKAFYGVLLVGRGAVVNSKGSRFTYSSNYLNVVSTACPVDKCQHKGCT